MCVQKVYDLASMYFVHSRHLQCVCSELGVKFSENTMSSFLLTNDVVGIAENGSALQSLIDVIDIYIIIVNVSGLKPA